MVVQGVEAIAQQLPVEMRGIDSDNDPAFRKETLAAHCRDRGIEFTRSRAYRKNDQAWIGRTNGAVELRFAGYAARRGP